MEAKFHGSSLRKGRYSAKGQIYLITTVTKNRFPAFLQFTTARLLVKSLQSSDLSGVTQTMCWVIMPDHIHWLFELKQEISLSTVVKNIKGRFSRNYNKISGYSKNTFWQSGFHDRGLRSEDDLISIARYIVANPLRAKLVNNIGSYPHWDAIWI